MTTPNTPGPWRIDGAFIAHGPEETTPDGYKRRNVVCQMHGQALDTARANARLIAAAPEMLAFVHAVAALRGPLYAEARALLARLEA